MSWGFKAEGEDSRAEWERKWGGVDVDGKKKKEKKEKKKETLGEKEKKWVF